MAEKKINGRTFKTEPMLATDALVLQARLLKVVGPLVGHLGEIFKGRDKDATDEDKERSNVAALAAFADIFRQAEPKELASLIKDVVETAQIKRDSGSYDNCDLDGDFTDRKQDIIPLVVFVLREQFSDFFKGLPGIGNLGSRLQA